MIYKTYFLFTVLFYFISAGYVKSQDNNEPHGYLSIQRYAVKTETDVYDNPLFVNVNLTDEQSPQNEPSVRISRLNPDIIVAAWRDFRLGYDPPVRRIGYSYSTDGGVTWSVSQLLPSPLPEHATQSDPVLTNDNDGNFYLATTSREQTNTRGETVIYKSTNNGVNWVKYSVAAQSSSFEDKEWIACDLVPGSPYFNSLNITWTRIGGGSGIKFTKSTNGGLNWTAPVNVSSSGFGQGSNIAIGTNHYIYVVWQSGGIKFDRSTDGGASFGADYQLSNITSTGSTYPFICVDYSSHATRGNVYVVWADSRQGSMDVWFQRSTDGGASWLANPVRVNDAATNDQYWPAIQCDTNGVLYVIYYDERLSSSQVNSYIAYSTDAGDTWNNQRLGDMSFPLISVNYDVRTGDYIGIDAFANKVVPVWTDDRAGTPNQEIYTAHVDGLISVGIARNNVPQKFKLYQNYPNPFNPETIIKFDVPSSASDAVTVRLSVYDVLGREITVLASEKFRAGTYEYRWDASNVAGGVYFCKLTAGSFTNTKKMVLVK